MSADWENLGIYSRTIFFTMSLAQDLGQREISKRQLVKSTGASKVTVLRATGDLERMGWVEATRSVNPETGCHNSTMYALTADAPHHSELLNILLGPEL